ncbi:hypothetical protein ACRJ4B_49880 [Streptomyces sp. GTA36]
MDDVSDPLAKAEAAVTAAETNTAAVQLALAAVELAKLSAQQQATQHTCQHQHAQPDFNARKWLVIGGVGCVCAVAFAVASVAIAISACCATGCFVILRSIWQSTQKGN